MLLGAAFEAKLLACLDELLLAEGAGQDVEDVLRMVGQELVFLIDFVFHFLAEVMEFHPDVTFERPFHVVFDCLRPLAFHDVEYHGFTVGDGDGA